VSRCLQQNLVGASTLTLSKMYTAVLIYSVCVELNANVNFQHAALELSVDTEFLLSGTLLFMYVMIFVVVCK